MSHSVAIVGAIDGQTANLADGRQLRLAAIATPRESEDRPLAERALRYLAALVDGPPVGLALAGREHDRYRRVVAHVVDPAGRWLQGELVAAGLARVEPIADQRGGVAALLALEAEARARRLGIWRLAAYRVLTPAEAARRRDVLVIVEGRVLRGERPRGGFALILSDTPALRVVVPFARRAVFRAAGLDPSRMEGESLRVRGYVRFERGAMIEAAVPEQIEVLR